MPHDPIRDELERIKAKSAELGVEFRELMDRIRSLESVWENTPIAEQVEPDPVEIVKPSLVAESEIPVAETLPMEPTEEIDLVEPEPVDSFSTRPDTSSAISFEQLIGQNWLNRIGAMVLLLCAFFFVKYAFDQGWLSPAARVLIGGLAGVALIVTGEVYLRKSLRAFAGGLLGCGIGVLYLAAFGAYNFYDLVGSGTASILYTIVTVISIAVSIHARMQPVAILAVIGGFATPIAMHTNTNQQVALMSYMLVLNAGLLVSAHIRRWDAVRSLAWLGTVVLFMGWFSAHYDSGAAWKTVAFLFAFYLQFHASIIVGLRRNAINNHHIASALIQFDNAVFFAGTYFLLRNDVPDWLGLFAVVAGAAQWFLAWRVCPKDNANASPNQALWQGGAGMIALAAPIQFDRYLVCVAWAIQSAITFHFCRRSTYQWLRLKGFGVFIAALFHFVLFDAQDAALTKQIAQFGFATFSWIIALGIIIGFAAYAGAANLIIRRSPTETDRRLSVALILIGTIVMMAVCAWKLDRYLADWMWLALGGLWYVVSRKHAEATILCIAIGLATVIKFMTHDTIPAANTGYWLQYSDVIANRAVLTGLAIAGFLTWIRHAEPRIPNWLAELGPMNLIVKFGFPPIAATLALLLVTWTGTFEIIRIFDNEPPDWINDPRKIVSLAVTIFWIANAFVLWITVRHDRPNITRYAFVLLFIAAIKYVFADALADALGGEWRDLQGLCANRVFAVGIILIAVTSFAFTKLRKHRSIADGSEFIFRSANATALLVATALLIAWVPTYEIVRAFRFEPFRQQFNDPGLAMQVAISIYWSFNAVALVVIGIKRHLTALRYLGIGLFALTVAKVFRFDIWHFATIYRILSCLVLGVLLLFASLQYQRRAMQPKST